MEINDYEVKYAQLKQSMKKQMHDTDRLVQEQRELVLQIQGKREKERSKSREGDKATTKKVKAQYEAMIMKLKEKHYQALQQRENRITKLQDEINSLKSE